MSATKVVSTKVPTNGNRAQRRHLAKLMRRKGTAKQFHLSKSMVAEQFFKKEKEPERVSVPKVEKVTRRRKKVTE